MLAKLLLFHPGDWTLHREA